MTPAELAEIRARAEAATPGPWECEQHENSYSCDVLDGDRNVVALLETNYDEQDEVDAQFIAHARTDIPRLLDALEAAQREAELYRPSVMTIEVLETRIEKLRAARLTKALADAQARYAHVVNEAVAEARRETFEATLKEARYAVHNVRCELEASSRTDHVTRRVLAALGALTLADIAKEKP